MLKYKQKITYVLKLIMSVAKALILDYLVEIIYFPFWWYTKGFFKTLKGTINSILDYQNSLGFSIWVKNIFVPMFGQADWKGRIVSFFMRFFNVLFRGLALLIIIVIHLAFLAIWLIAPIFIIYQVVLFFTPQA